MFERFCSIMFLFILFLFPFQNAYSLFADAHTYLQVYSAEVSDDCIEPFQTLTFSGKIYYNGTMIPPFSENASLYFDGVDDFVVVADSQSLNIPEHITISCWVKTTRIGEFQRILWKHDAFGLTVNPFGKIYGTVWIAGFSQDSYSSVTNVADGSWHLCTYVYDGHEHRIYVDGVLESIKNQTGVIQTSSKDLFIGKQEENSLYPFEGAIDDVRVYNRSLNLDEISGIFKGTLENETDMVAHWSFDGDGLDKSGNGNDGLIYGATWTDGWANIHVYLELNGLLKITVSLVNSTNGNFVFPWIAGESEPGVYNYTIYVENGVKNQTLTVTVETPTPPEITILSPKNMTYATDSIPLIFTVNKLTSWIGYSLDGNVNLTINENTTLQELSTGTHKITVYANSTFGKMGASETIHFMVDTVPPAIVNVYSLPEGDVMPEQQVKISVNVTDIGSGIDEVVLSYTVDNGTSWGNVTMNYNATTRMYEGIIPGQTLGTLTKYKIIAYDKANNSIIADNEGQYYQYTVIPEFPAITFMALFILLTLIATILIKESKLSIATAAES